MDKRIRASRKQEKNLARDLGGKITPCSGAGWAVKNDVRTDIWSVEAKTTGNSRYTLTHNNLIAAERNALLDNREMAFAIEMAGRTWMVVSLETFLERFKDGADGHLPHRIST
jgi:hypothetical protein